MTLRIAHLGPPVVPVWHQRGGALQRRMVELARAQARMGDHPLLVSPAAPAHDTREGDVETPAIACRLQRPWRDYEFVWRARRTLDRFQPDVVHFHGTPHGAVLMGGEVPSLLTADWFRWRGSGRGLGRRIYSWWLSRFTAVTAVSEYCHGRFTAFWPEVSPVYTVPNGVNLDQFRPDPESGARMRSALGISPSAAVVLYVGRVCEQKGSDTLLSAVPAVRDALRPVQFVVAGPPSQFGQTRPTSLLARMINAGVRYLGAADEGDLAALYNMCDVFVMPTSRAEMFGMAVAEAEACGKPVVCSALGGLLEAASERSALFVRPRDAAALSAGITTLLSDPERRARMGAAGIQHVRRFAWPAVATSFRAVYEEMLADGSSTAVAGRRLAGGR